MRIESAAASHVGRRSNNEDAYCADPGTWLFAVADGMGGYEGGEIASRLVIDTLQEFVRRNVMDAETTWPFKRRPELSLDENVLAVGTQLAQKVVVQHQTPKLAQMGSTLVALLVHDGEAVVAHVGDSRIYRLRDGVVEQLTHDHSVYGEMMRRSNGDLPPKDRVPFGHLITRAIGTERADAEVQTVPVQPGDVFLLCSDGLYEVLSTETIASVLASHAPEAACQELIAQAYAAGSKDNITGVVVAVRG